MARFLLRVLNTPFNPLLFKKQVLALCVSVVAVIALELVSVLWIPDTPHWLEHVMLVVISILLLVPVTYLVFYKFRLYHQRILGEVAERERTEVVLSESKDKYRAIIEQFAEGITLIDEQGTVTEWNQVMESITGLTSAEIIGTPLWEVMYRLTVQEHQSDEGREQYKHAIFDALHDRESTHLSNPEEVSIRMPDGGFKPVQINRFAITINHGRQIGMLVRDDTERKRAIEALRDSETRYRMLAEAAHDAIFVINRDGNVEYVNSFAAQLVGLPAERVIGSPMEGLFPPAIGEAQADELRTVLNTLKPSYSERLTTFQQGDIWLGTSLVPLLDEAGMGRAVLGIARDITERKQAEQKLQVSEERHRSALESMLEGVQIIGYNWRYLFINDSAASHGKRKKEELLGYTMMESYPGIENTAMFAALRRCMAERTSHSMENEFMYPDGSKSWFELSIQPTQEGLLVLSSDITDRKQAEERIETQMRRLAALRSIDLAIVGSLGLQSELSEILEHVTAQLDIDAACVHLLNPDTKTLTYAAGRGFRTRAIEQTQVRLGEGISSQSILSRQVVHLQGPTESADFTRAALLEGESFVEYYGAPLTVKDHIIGVLEVFHRTPCEASEEWRIFLETLAGQTAIAVDNAQLFENLQRSNMDLSIAYDATIEGWSRALDLRDKETEGHTQRVTLLTERLARLMGISEAELMHIRRGALLHDIGKMGVPDSILHKPGPLTEEEWVLMRRHPRYAYEMLSPIAFLQPALDIPYCHHEKWDGSGYPLGLRGENIPLAARIFAVVDVWDALLSDRPYRKGWPREQAIEHIGAQSGSHFDPQVVKVFLQVIGETEVAV